MSWTFFFQLAMLITLVLVGVSVAVDDAIKEWKKK